MEVDRVKVGLDVSAIPDDPRGAGRYVVELTRALARRGNIELHLQARKGDAARWQAVAPGSEVRAIVPTSRPMRLAWEQVAAPRTVDRWGVDIYHGPHYTMPELAKLPKVVTVHDVTFFDHPEWHEKIKVALFTRAIRAAAQLATAIICDSRATADRLQELVDAKCPVSVVHLGVDHDVFHPGGDPAADRRLLAELGIEPPFIGYVGTFEPRKGVDDLVRAFDLIASEHPSVKLVLAGGAGWGEQAITAALDSSGARDRIVCPGYLADGAIPALFRQAVAVAYPSVVEGFGLPALEALACGANLITTAGTSMEEVAGDGALLVPAGDAIALAPLRRTLGSDGAAGARRQRGLERAARFTWDETAANHERVYAAAAAATQPRR